MDVKSHESRIRIESIDITFSPAPDHPINLKVLLNNVALVNLPDIPPGQQTGWKNIRSFDIDLNSTVELRVYQVRKWGITRSRLGSVSFVVDLSEMTIVRNFTGPPAFTVTATLKTAAQASEPANRPAVNTESKRHWAVVNSMTHTSSVIESAFGMGSIFADLIPGVSTIKDLVVSASETLKQREQSDEALADLVIGLDDMLPIADAVPDRAEARRLKGIVAEMLQFVEDGSKFVIEYDSDGMAARALRVFGTSTAQEQVDNYLKQLGRWKERYDREMTIYVAQTTDILLTDADQTLLDRLVVAGASYDHTDSCLAGTRQQLISDISRWATRPNGTDTFWLYGLAGSGKSAIAASICTRLERSGLLGASFFCKRDDSELHDLANIISTIAASLARAYKPYGVKLLKILRDDYRLFSSALLTRFTNLLLDPLQEADIVPTGQHFVVVIDALDECGKPESRKRLLYSLLQLTRTVPWIKLFLTSRPTEEIRSILLDPRPFLVRCRDLTQEDPSTVLDDISVLVEQSLRNTSLRTRWPTWPEQHVISEVSARSTGLFIWAQTACRFIASGRDPKARLQQVLEVGRPNDATAQLGHLYTTALDESFDGADDNAEIIRTCVGAVVLTGTRSPLPDLALGALLADLVDLTVLQGVIDSLGAVLYRDNGGAVRVLHQSFSDFILDQIECPPRYRTNVLLQNAQLAASCLRIMIQELRFNMCELTSSYHYNEEISGLDLRVQDRISAHLAYSSLHWISHLTATHRNILTNDMTGQQAVGSLLNRFMLEVVSLYWVEALSLLKGLRQVLIGLPNLTKWLEDPDHQLARWSDEMHRFIFALHEPISKSTPHLYLSALPFAAVNYEVACRWKLSFPGVMSIVQGENLLSANCLRVFPTHVSPGQIAASPDGKHIASCNFGLAIWDVETGELVLTGQTGTKRNKDPWATCVAFSSDSRYLAWGTGDADLLLIGPEITTNGIAEPLLGHTDCLLTVLFTPDSQRIVSGSRDRLMCMWDVESRSQILTLKLDDSSSIASTVISPDSLSIKASLVNGTITTWEPERQIVQTTSLQQFSDFGAVVTAFSPDGLRFVAGADKMVYVWDVSTGYLQLGSMEGHTGLISCVSFSPNGQLILTGDENGEVRIWDAQNGKELANQLICHSGRIHSIAFTLGGQRIVTSSGDRTIRMWPALEQVAFSDQSNYHSRAISSVAFSPDGARVVSGSLDATVRIWDSHTGTQLLAELKGHSAAVTSVAVSLDGRTIASGSKDCSIRIWDAYTGAVTLEPMRGHTDSVNSIAFSPNGQLLVSGSADGTIRLWNTQTGAIALQPLRYESESIMSVGFSSSGRYICAGTQSSRIVVWDMGTSAIVHELHADHDCPVYSVAFSPNESSVACAGGDKEVTLWRLETEARVALEYGSSGDTAMSLAFSPDGAYIASAVGNDVRVWSTESANLLNPLRGHRQRVLSVAFSPCGKRIVSSSIDKTIRVWDLATVHKSTSASSDSPSALRDHPNIMPIEKKKSRVHSWELDVQQSGWLLNSVGDLVLWVPDQYLQLKVDESALVISPSVSDSHVVYDFSKFEFGTTWTKAHVSQKSSGSV